MIILDTNQWATILVINNFVIFSHILHIFSLPWQQKSYFDFVGLVNRRYQILNHYLPNHLSWYFSSLFSQCVGWEMGEWMYIYLCRMKVMFLLPFIRLSLSLLTASVKKFSVDFHKIFTKCCYSLKERLIESWVTLSQRCCHGNHFWYETRPNVQKTLSAFLFYLESWDWHHWKGII